jgi:1-acyl-sn-glycerol-3-phosphate acyltransferase
LKGAAGGGIQVASLAAGAKAATKPTRPGTRLLAEFIQFTVGYLFLRPWYLFGFRGRLRRSRQQPAGPCVFAANHRSYFDPPFVGMFQLHPIAYFARGDLWDKPVIAFFLEAMQGIPVDRANPGLSSMKGAVDRLRRGISVLVFPEGTRTRDGRISAFREGPALFARRAGVPIVPVYLHRSERVWPRGAKLPTLLASGLEVRIGTPIHAPAGLEPRAQDAWVSRRLEAWMRVQERDLLGPR